jgi:hypothetical protein
MRLHLENVKVAPVALRRVVITPNLLAAALGTGTLLRGPQRRCFSDMHHHFAVFLKILNPRHFPFFAQTKNVMKYFFRNHVRAIIPNPPAPVHPSKVTIKSDEEPKEISIPATVQGNAKLAVSVTRHVLRKLCKIVTDETRKSHYGFRIAIFCAQPDYNGASSVF